MAYASAVALVTAKNDFDLNGSSADTLCGMAASSLRPKAGNKLPVQFPPRLTKTPCLLDALHACQRSRRVNGQRIWHG